MQTRDRLLIPDYDPYDPQPYPGDIQPSYYDQTEVQELLRKHAGKPEAVQFIQDMLEQ